MYLNKNYLSGGPFNWAFGFLILAFLLFILSTCNNSSEYHKLEAKELASGIRNDSLFLGLYFGMTQKEFFTVCWDLSKKGVMWEGPTGATVHYPIKTFQYPANMDFYPIFHEDKIVGIPAVFTYDSWAPWNKHLQAEPLQKEILDLITNWYGPGFIEVENPSTFGGKAFVKIDGNRRITIYYKDDAKVQVDFVDLVNKRQRESATENR